MNNYLEVHLGSHTYKLDESYKIIAMKKRFSWKDLKKLTQPFNGNSNYWRDESPGVIESLDGNLLVLCSSSELEGIDLIFEKRMDRRGKKFYRLNEENKNLINGKKQVQGRKH